MNQEFWQEGEGGFKYPLPRTGRWRSLGANYPPPTRGGLSAMGGNPPPTQWVTPSLTWWKTSRGLIIRPPQGADYPPLGKIHHRDGKSGGYSAPHTDWRALMTFAKFLWGRTIQPP